MTSSTSTSHVLVPSPGTHLARAGAGLTLASMTCVQLGLATSVVVAERLGGVEVAWLRLLWAALLCALVGRVWRLRLRPDQLRVAVLLGVATGTFTVCFMAAAARLPLGTVSALEFLGPLGVALAGRRGLSPLWPCLAAVGVLCLTSPWSGDVDPVGVAFALGSAAGYAAYIVLTQRVGAVLPGIAGLGVSMPVAAAVATLVAVQGDLDGLVDQLDLTTVLTLLGLAVLVPVVPYSLEMVALRWVDTAVFGTLVCLEPALACLAGLVLLGQVPTLTATGGIVLVVLAGIAVTVGPSRVRGRRRAPSPA